MNNVTLKAVYSFVFLLIVFASNAPAASQDNNVEWNGLLHNSFDSFFRSPFGAVPTGTPVNLKFRTFRNDVTAIYLRVYELDPISGATIGPIDSALNFSSSDLTYDYWQINFSAPATPKLFYYKFRVVDGTDEDFYSDFYYDDHDNLNQGGEGLTTDNEPFPSFQLTVYKSDFATPSWFQNSTVYQIFVDRFRNGDITNDWCRSGSNSGCPSLYGSSPASNITHTIWNEQMIDPRATGNNNAYGSQFYGGDLRGIEQKLDYIQSLGVDTIYLNPIFSARSNHGYDADNYEQIAPQIGGDSAFDSLVAAANARGIKIILDGVWNHVSQDSLYMDYFHRYAGDGGCESFTSPYRSWFVWNASATTVPCTTAHYNGWFGFSGLPELTEIAEVRDFFFRNPSGNITKKWLDRGASGWRFDVADNISTNWWTEYRGYAKAYKSEAPLIGEVWPDASRYLAGNQLDGVMNYRFRKNVLGFARATDFFDNDNNGTNRIFGLSPSQFGNAMRAIREDYPLPAQLSMMNLLGSHDTNRALYVLKNSSETQAQAKERLKLAAIFQFTYLGAPMIYYGDETVINSPSVANNGSGLPEDDPYNRAPFPWDDENGDPNIYGPADDSFTNFYSVLSAIRKSHPALRTGTFQELLTGDSTPPSTDENTYAFARTNGIDKVVIALNNGNSSNSVVIPVGAHFPDGTQLNDLLGVASLRAASFTVSDGNLTVNLPARSGAIFALAPAGGPTATVSGRVRTANGFGVRRVRIRIQDSSNTISFNTKTDGDGYFRVGEVPIGNVYTVTAELRFYRITEPGRTFSLTGNLSEVNFRAVRLQ